MAEFEIANGFLGSTTLTIWEDMMRHKNSNAHRDISNTFEAARISVIFIAVLFPFVLNVLGT